MTIKNKILAVLSYFCFLVIIPLIFSKKDGFIEFHAKQGVVLVLLWILVPFVFWIPLIGWLVGPLLLLFCIILWIGGITMVLKEKEQPLPLVGIKIIKVLF